MCDRVDKYRVYYREQDSDRMHWNVSITNNTSLRIDNLPPFTVYDMKITILNNAGLETINPMVLQIKTPPGSKSRLTCIKPIL